MKSDSQLQRDVTDELHWDPQTSRTELGVAVKDSVITLTGTVDSYSQKLAAERAAERVNGVKAVAEELEVRLPGSVKRTDTEIAHAAVNALMWDTEVPDDQVKVKVENGWISLEGSVTFRFQSEAAERAVRYLMGVKGVTNLVRVTPPVSTMSVKTKIEDAFRRSADVDSKRISVEAIDGKVTLKGTVRSWTERRDAERAAWSAPGVKQVEDNLLVTV